MRPSSPIRSQLVLVGAHGGRLLLNLAATWILGRTIDTDDFGFFSFIATVFTSMNFILDLGTVPLAVREIIRNPSREIPLIEGLLAWRAALGLALGILAAALACAEADSARRIILFGSAATFPIMASGALYPAFQVRQRIEAPAFLSVLGALAILLCIVAFAKNRVAGVHYAWLNVGREFTLSAVLLVLGARLLGRRLRPGLTRRGLGSFGRMALVYGLATLLHTAFFYEDVFIVRAFRGDTELGSYAAAFRLFNPFMTLPPVLMLPMLPVLSGLATQDRPLFRARVRESSVRLGLAGLVGGAGAFLLAPDVLRLVYGGRYLEGTASAVQAMRWLSVAFVAAFAMAGWTTALLADGRERKLVDLGIFGLALNLSGNLLFVPAYGFNAAAIMTAVTEVSVAIAAGVIHVRGLQIGSSSRRAAGSMDQEDEDR